MQFERSALALSELASAKQNIDTLITITAIFMAAARWDCQSNRASFGPHGCAPFGKCLFEKGHSDFCVGPPNKSTPTTYSLNHDVKLFGNILYRQCLYACAFFGEVRDPALDTRLAFIEDNDPSDRRGSAVGSSPFLHRRPSKEKIN
jgi:hypothetical protein